MTTLQGYNFLFGSDLNDISKMVSQTKKPGKVTEVAR